MERLTKDRRETIRSWKRNPQFKKGTRPYKVLAALYCKESLTLKELQERDTLDTLAAVKETVGHLSYLRERVSEARMSIRYYETLLEKREESIPIDYISSNFRVKIIILEQQDENTKPSDMNWWFEKIDSDNSNFKNVSPKIGLKLARISYTEGLKNYHKSLMDFISISKAEKKVRSSYANYNLGICLAVLHEQGYIKKPRKGVYAITAKGKRIFKKKLKEQR